MAIYFFNLKTTNAVIQDPEGTELADESSAREHARQVACELMRRREPQSRSWRIEVCDSQRRHCFELLFASIDETIAPLGPELRDLIENLHRKQASLIDAIGAVRLSLRQIQATIARSKRLPFLIAIDGVTVATCDQPARQYACDDEVATVAAARPEIAANLAYPRGSRRHRSRSRSGGIGASEG
jgi:hypothetical protein